MFTYIHSLLIEKDDRVRQNILIKFPCVFVILSYSDLFNIWYEIIDGVILLDFDPSSLCNKSSWKLDCGTGIAIDQNGYMSSFIGRFTYHNDKYNINIKEKPGQVK